jgi:hypothetical protein
MQRDNIPHGLLWEETCERIFGNRRSDESHLENTVNDAYCGVAYVTADQVYSGVYMNALYATLNADLYPTTFPPAVEP